MRKKKNLIGAAVLICLSFVLFTACAKKESKEIAFIQTEKTAKTEPVYAEILRGIDTFAKTYQKGYQVIESRDNEKKSFEDSVKKAIKDGARVIVLHGDKISPAVYDMQLKHKKTEFLFFEGIPKNARGKEKIRENTTCVYFKEQEAGFLAGYAAVAEGHKKLGFIESQSNGASKKYGSGFVQGAEAAANALGIGQGEVTLSYKRIANGNLSPVTSGLVRSWYGGGSEVIMAGGENLLNNVFIGSQGQENKKVIVQGDYEGGDSAMVETAAKKDYAGAVNYLLTAYEGRTLKKGERIELGIDEDSVSLAMNISKFQNFTQESYGKLINDFKGGAYTLKADYLAGGEVGLDTNLVNLTVEE